MNRNKEIKAVIFDMDGVILDSERTLSDEWAELAKTVYLPDIRNVYISICGTTKKVTGEIMRKAYGSDFDFEYYNHLVYQMRDEKYKDGLPLKPGIRELLKMLKEKGIKTALATSTYRERARSQLMAVDLFSYFDKFISGEMVTKSKPDPEIFLMAMDALKEDPCGSIIIEDSYNGVRAAHSSGAETIMVPDLKAPDEEISRLCDHIFPSLNEVREYICAI